MPSNCFAKAWSTGTPGIAGKLYPPKVISAGKAETPAQPSKGTAINNR